MNLKCKTKNPKEYQESRFLYNTSNNLGITLISLIITIIVLLILAVVTIGVVQENGILSYAKNASKEYRNASGDENTVLHENANYIKENADFYEKAVVGEEAIVNSTINGRTPNANNPVIPKGFKAINDGANWDDPNGPEVTKGLVISDGTSEFVWIPVPNLNEMAIYKTDENDRDVNNRINYRGILYDWVTDEKGNTVYQLSNNSYREPATIGEDDSNVSSLLETRYKTFEEQMQAKFNEMVEGVKKYGGFYVGRYETSLNTQKVAQSVKGVAPLTGGSWFATNAYAKKYGEDKEGITSEMIWGCQWDAMLRFILKGKDASHVTSIENVCHSYSKFKSIPYKTGGTDYDTKCSDIENYPYNDVANNIYDLEGNLDEWTQEAYSSNNRVIRGGNCHIRNSPPSNRNPFETNRGVPVTGFRLTFYVNNF